MVALSAFALNRPLDVALARYVALARARERESLLFPRSTDWVALRTDASEEEDVRGAIRGSLVANVPKTKCPAVLRLVFHDAGTYLASAKDGGMNASVRFELNRPESFGLKRGLSVVKSAYDALEGTPAEGKVSFADMIACAGAYAVEFTGGPRFLERVRLGRVDTSEADPENRMPEQTLGGVAMREHFARSGVSTRDMVALAGAHTIGGKGFGDAYTFDNAYYVTLVADPWHKPDMTKDEAEMAEHIGLPSDKFMREDEENMAWIQKYADDQNAFFVDFVDAYLRLTELGANFA
jgi:L-ascorbate peroxidase